MKHVIYVDAGYREGVGGHIAWFNKTTDKKFYDKREYKDSFRCEYEAIIQALKDHEEIIKDNEIEILIDSKVVAEQLNHKSAMNSDDIRDMAFKIWNMTGKNIRFLWIQRKDNKAGKILGS